MGSALAASLLWTGMALGGACDTDEGPVPLRIGPRIEWPVEPIETVVADEPAPGWGRVVVSASWVPADGVTVRIRVAGIAALRAEDEWEPLSGEPLWVELGPDGAETSLLDSRSPPASLRRLRLTLDQDGEVVTADGTVHPLRVQGGDVDFRLDEGAQLAAGGDVRLRTRWDVEDDLTLLPNGTYRLIPTPELVDVVTTSPCTPVRFADPALETRIREALDLPSGPITSATARRVVALDAAGSEIADLTAIGCLQGLKALDLAENPLRDLAPLARMPALDRLVLRDTTVDDLAPLSALVDLKALDISNTQVSDLTPLAPMIGLRRLRALDSRKLTSLAPVADHPDLEVLRVSRAPLQSPWKTVASLPALEFLQLDQAGLTDLAAAAQLPNLEVLSVDDNTIGDLLPLAGHPALRDVSLRRTSVMDAWPLTELPALERVWLDGSPVACADGAVQALTKAGVFVRSRCD